MHKDVVRYLPVRNSFSEAVPDFNPTVSGSPGTTKDDAVDSSKETAALSTEETLEETPEMDVSSPEREGKTTIYTSDYYYSVTVFPIVNSQINKKTNFR
jgi:hypothetical protein